MRNLTEGNVVSSWSIRVGDQAMDEDAESWLRAQENLGRARNTILAYRYALTNYFGFCEERQAVAQVADREHIALYVRSMTDSARPTRRATPIGTPPRGLANATIRQRLSAVRLYYDHLVEEGVL